MEMIALFLAVASTFFFMVDRYLRRGADIDDIKHDPRLSGYLLLRPLWMVCAGLAVVVLTAAIANAV